MSRNVTRYRLTDGVGLINSGFIGSRFVAYWRFLAAGLFAVVVWLHKIPTAFVPGASRTPALRTSQRTHAVWVPRSDAVRYRDASLFMFLVIAFRIPHVLVHIINSPSIANWGWFAACLKVRSKKVDATNPGYIVLLSAGLTRRPGFLVAVNGTVSSQT